MIFDWANSVMFNCRNYYVVEDYGVVTAVPEYAEPNMYGQYPTVRLIRDENGDCK